MEGLTEFTRALGDLTKEKPKDGKTTRRLQTEANEFLVKKSSQKGGAVLVRCRQNVSPAMVHCRQNVGIHASGPEREFQHKAATLKE